MMEPRFSSGWLAWRRYVSSTSMIAAVVLLAVLIVGFTLGRGTTPAADEVPSLDEAPVLELSSKDVVWLEEVSGIAGMVESSLGTFQEQAAVFSSWNAPSVTQEMAGPWKISAQGLTMQSNMAMSMMDKLRFPDAGPLRRSHNGLLKALKLYASTGNSVVNCLTYQDASMCARGVETFDEANVLWGEAVAIVETYR